MRAVVSTATSSRQSTDISHTVQDRWSTVSNALNVKKDRSKEELQQNSISSECIENYFFYIYTPVLAPPRRLGFPFVCLSVRRAAQKLTMKSGEIFCSAEKCG